MTSRSLLPESLSTERLRLNRATESDLEEFAEKIYRDAEVMRTLPGGKACPLDEAMERSRRSLIAGWEERGLGPWVMREKASGALVGRAGLKHWFDSDEVEVLYALTPDRWGRGYATEAAVASVDVGFRILGLQRIIAGVVPENLGSVRVIEKLGLTWFERIEIAGLIADRYELFRANWLRRNDGGEEGRARRNGA